MITAKRIFSLMVALIVLGACSNNDDSDDGGNPNIPDPNTGPRLVKAEIGPIGTNIQYEYNENELLKTWTGTFPTFGYEITSEYNDDGNATVWNYIDSDDFTYSQGFSYDFEGNLIGYIGNTEDVTLNYDGNMVTVTGTIEGDMNASAVIELNGNGKVIKFTESNQYSTLSYDANGNLTRVLRFDLQDNLLNEFKLTYDSKKNPYFGQMESVYLERFIEYFWEFDGIYFTGLEGYSFPYNRNNVVGVEQDGNNIITYSIGYDNEDYPTVISEIISGNSFQFDITYY